MDAVMIRFTLISAVSLFILAHPIRAQVPLHGGGWNINSDPGTEEYSDFLQLNNRKPEVSRADQLKHLREIAKKYPYSPSNDLIEEAIIVLERMAIEENERSRRPSRPPREMTENERIADLIHRLRDQAEMCRGDSWKEPRFIGTPAQILIAHGYAAVPQLIDALDDDSFNRCNREPQRVGDCAGMILNEIAGRSLAGESFVEAGRIEETRKNAVAWWRDYQAKGEKQMLIEGVETGDGDSEAQAIRLVEKYPAVALPVIETAFWRTKQSELIDATEALKGKEVEAFLNMAVLERDLEVSIAAAQQLNRRGSLVGVRTLIAKFDETRIPTSVSRNRTTIDQLRLIMFLSECRRPEAIIALAEKMDFMPPILRGWTIGLLDVEMHATDEYRQAMVRLLSERLDDLAESDFEVLYQSSSSQIKRVCDVAATSLARIRGCRPVVLTNNPLRLRERQRLTLLNEWRKQHGLTPVPIPVAARVAPSPSKVVQPLLQQFINEKTAPGRHDIGAKIEALGPGALSAIHALLKTLPANDHLVSELTAIAGRVSFFVADICFVEDGIPIPKEVRESLERYKGKSIPWTEREMELLTDAGWRELPDTTHGRILIERPIDGTGVIITVSWSATDASRVNDNCKWVNRERLVVGGEYWRAGGETLNDLPPSDAPWRVKLQTLPTDKDVLIQFDLDFLEVAPP